MKIAIILLAIIIGLVSARLPPPDKQLAASSSSTPEPGSDDTGVIENEAAAPGSTTDDDDHDPQYPFNVFRKILLRPMSTSFNNFPGMSDTPFVRIQPMFPQNPFSIFSMDPAAMIRNRPSLLGSQPSMINSQFPSIFDRTFEFPFPRMPHFPSMVDHPSLFDPEYEKNLAAKGYNVTKSFLPNSGNKMVIIRSVKNTTDTYAEYTKVRPFIAEMDKDLVSDETSSSGEDKKNNDRREVEAKPTAAHEIEDSGSEKSTDEDKKPESESSSPAASNNVPAESASKQPKPEVKNAEKEPELKDAEKEAKKDAKAPEGAKTDGDKPAENEIPKSGSDAEIKSDDTPIITVNDNKRQ